MKYLIIEAYTDANIGSGALVENTIGLLEKANKARREDIRVMAHYPSVFEEKYGVKAVKDIFNYPFNQPRIRQAFWLLKTTMWMAYAWLFPRKALNSSRWQDYKWADVIISVGAERINDKYIKNELFSLFTYGVVKKFGKKMVLAPSTYGPFLHRYTRRSAASIFRQIDLIYCRDQRSYNTIIQFSEGGGSNLVDKIINTSDVAIFQKWDSDYKQHYFDDEKLIVGISVLEWTYVHNKYETPYCSYSSYVREMSEFIGRIIHKFDVNVILYPTNFPVNGCREDDVRVVRQIHETCRDKAQVKYIDQLLSPHEFKSLLSCSAVNITTRMHACILSTSAHVPTMSINYLFKLKEYMDGLGLSDYSIDIEDFCADAAMPLFEKLWKNKDHIREELSSKIQQKKTQLEKDFRRISY